MNKSPTQNQAQSVAELATIVQESCECAKALLNVLEQEHEALCSGDVAGIDRCGQTKTDCVSKIESLSLERIEMCRVLAVVDTSIDDFLSVHNKDVRPEHSWQSLLVCLQQCREANELNGRVAFLRRRHVERALQVLRGGEHNGPGLYGPNGLDETKNVTTLGQA